MTPGGNRRSVASFLSDVHSKTKMQQRATLAPELVMNLETATVLDMKIPQTLLLRADEVLQ